MSQPADGSVEERHARIYERLEFVPFRKPERLSLAFYGDLDRGIADVVAILDWHGIETCQSCQGANYDAATKTWSGVGHCYPEPTVDFLGDDGAGMRALGVALMYALPVTALRRSWNVNRNGVLHEVVWQLVFDESLREASSR